MTFNMSISPDISLGAFWDDDDSAGDGEYAISCCSYLSISALLLLDFRKAQLWAQGPGSKPDP